MRKALSTIVLVICGTFVCSQSKLNISYACSYYGEKSPASVYTFASDNEALSALRMITDASGLATNFKLLAANVPNAAAVIFNNERYILYNQTFMYNISQRINYWASISILAHEVGHHLNGHSLTPGGSRPNLELEADKFSGFVLSKLGSSLQDAQSAINSLVSENESLTHPGKSARLAAIASGWYENNSKNISVTNNILKPSQIFCGEPTSREQLFIKKTSNYSYKIISEKGYEFRKSEYNERSISTNLKIFWFPDYSAYGYIDDFDELEEQKPYQLKKGNCTTLMDDGYLIKGNGLIIYFPNKTFYVIHNGTIINNLIYDRYVDQNRKYHYKFNYGSSIINIEVDRDMFDLSATTNKTLVGYGWED